jgi:hypothetical protein
MSELVARLAVSQLRNVMFSQLPGDVQSLFPLIEDPLVENGQTQVPNIVVGEYADYGANAPTPMIAVHCEGPQEGIVNVWRHLKLSIDMWVSGNTGGNVDGRRIVSIIYEYVNRALQNINWSGRGGAAGSSFVQIKRSYESERSSILFEPTNKIYRISNIYTIEALSQSWY